MRVLFWSDLFWPYLGGVETQAAGLLLALRDRGYELKVLTSQRDLDLPDEQDWRGIPVHRISFWRALEDGNAEAFLAAQRRARRLVEGFDPDLLHLNGVGPSASYCMRIAATSPVPLLVSLHQELRPSQTGGRETVLCKLVERADWVHSVSRTVLDQAWGLDPGLRGRSSVIGNFVEPPAFLPAPLPTRPARLLCLGRVIPQKGFDIALQAFVTIAARFADVLLTVAGDGVGREELERDVRSLGVADQVEFTGMVSPEDVFALINRSFAVLMPSRFEGFGVVAVEAAIMARPVIAAAVGGLRDVIEPELTGVLVPPEEPGALAEAVGRLLSNPAAAARMGAAARRRALAVFGKGACVDAYDALYHRLGRQKVAG